MPPVSADPYVLQFEDQRSRLLRIGLGILRSAPDAEDVVQEAWFRWQRTDRRDVDNVEAFLATVVTRLAIDRIRRIRSRREVYYGGWPAEPACTSPDQAEPDEQLVSTALAVLFETLSPLQRAAFVLRDVLAQPYAETAAALGREEPAVRQLVHRSRVRLRNAEASRPAERTGEAGLAYQFHLASHAADVTPLVDLLTSDQAVRGGRHRAKPARWTERRRLDGLHA